MADSSPGQRKDPGLAVSRRTVLGVLLAAAGSLLAACRGAAPAPAETPAALSGVAASPTTSQPSPTQTPARPADTPSPASTAASTAAHPSPQPTNTYPPPLPAATETPLPPTYTPVPATPTVPPPTSSPTPVLSRAAAMAHWPATASSRVVLVRHGGVWAGDELDSAVVASMLDEGLRTLVGAPDALDVWRVLFAPGERVLLKVNTISAGGPTQPAVAYAVAQRLIDAGLDGENILIFDRRSRELAAAGYSTNEGGPGIQCHGQEMKGTGSRAELSQATVRFFQELDDCDAVINLPTPKQHGMAGVSVSLKNHYGSVDSPSALHANGCDPAIAELNSQPVIRDKTRLIVGAALQVSPGNWDRPDRDNALLLSFDPVALDTVARDILVAHRQAQGLAPGSLVEGARHLATAQSLGLGATDADLIDLLEVVLA